MPLSKDGEVDVIDCFYQATANVKHAVSIESTDLVGYGRDLAMELLDSTWIHWNIMTSEPVAASIFPDRKYVDSTSVWV